MSRLLDETAEDRAKAKGRRLVRALEFGIADTLDMQGVMLMGFAFKFDQHSCLMTMKGVIAGKYHVAFVASDTVINVILRAYSDTNNDALHWRPDKYQV